MISDGTIVAQASAQGVARRGIVRVSGDEALDAVAPLFYRRERNEEFPPDPETALHVDAGSLISDPTQTAIVLGWLTPWTDAAPKRFVKCALFYWPKGRGFTGERAVELHLPGAPPILDAAVRSICATKRARLANRGEFTLRAFLSGRIDLTQAEAILGTIDATSDKELQNALRQLSGNLSRNFRELRDKLFDVLCDLEAGFDFVDEDIEFVSSEEIRARLEDAKRQVEETLQRAQTQLGTDEAPRVVLAGSPNAGKSSLFNKLVETFGGRSYGEALVSDVAGTTRDYLEADLCVDDIKFTLVDSAGVETFDETQATTPRALAQLGLKRLFANSALILRCVESNAKEDAAALDACVPSETPQLLVATKQDLEPEQEINDAIATSSKSGAGIDALGRRIADALRQETEHGEIVPSTAIRCQEALREANEALQNALAFLDDDSLRDDFLLASELRVALDRIGLVTGQVHTDDLLDRIFSRFCVGK